MRVAETLSLLLDDFPSADCGLTLLSRAPNERVCSGNNLTSLRYVLDVWSSWSECVSYRRVLRRIVMHALVYYRCESLITGGFFFSSSCVVFLQLHGRQSTGDKESSSGEAHSGRCTSATTPTQAVSWPRSRCPLIRTVRKPARWERTNEVTDCTGTRPSGFKHPYLLCVWFARCLLSL